MNGISALVSGAALRRLMLLAPLPVAAAMLTAMLTAVLIPELHAQPALPGQGPSAPRVPTSPATTPPGNDTTGYWQQRANYTIVATLDERMQAVRASGTLRYVNRSPDTLRELWVHQHLNAFRPGSRWSATDEREGRKRFQALVEPHFAYERFTAPTRINGTPVTAEYPLSPDSSVVRFALPSPLQPGDSLAVTSRGMRARPRCPAGKAVVNAATTSRSGIQESPSTTAAVGSRMLSCPQASSMVSSATSTSRSCCRTIRPSVPPVCR